MTQDIQYGKEEIKFYITDAMILLLKNLKKLPTKIIRANKQVQQVCKIQDKHGKISCISIY